MITFLVALALLVAGYLLYGRVAERVFGADDGRPVPSQTMADGVDTMPLGWKRIFLIQFLNIAGLGPIFGAIAGALWGPVAMIWIVVGCIFGGAVHDYMAAMISLRHGGASITEVVGLYLGRGAVHLVRVFVVALMVLVGVVFVKGPAAILEGAFPGLGILFWSILIFGYYFLATILPINALIGRLYPLFGAALLLMALGVVGGLLASGRPMMELTLANLHPKEVSLWPLMFISIACGAISGFHATQSPLMARCLVRESLGRRVFYGAMIAEGVIALIWAAAPLAFYGSTEALQAAMGEGGNAGLVVNGMTAALLGPIGGALAIVGIVACPITSGDTAFRSGRLILADAFHLDQRPLAHRMIIAVPLFGAGILLTQMDFALIWRYFAWANQTLATLVLWTCSLHLASHRRVHWITTVPAAFMTVVTISFILSSAQGLGLSQTTGLVAAVAVALALTVALHLTQRRPEWAEEKRQASGQK